MVTAKAALAAAATLVAVAFALCTFERFLARRRRHELAWTVALVMFALASACLWAGASNRWGEASFRLFFLFGAILNVPWLALGTIYLLGGRQRGDATARWLAVASAFCGGVILIAPLKGAIPAHELPQGRAVFGVLPRVMAAAGSGVGALVVIGGAVWSAWGLRRGRTRHNATSPRAGAIALGNILIAIGTIILGLSGTLSGRLGQQESFAVTLLVGIIVLFTGFLIATLDSRAMGS